MAIALSLNFLDSKITLEQLGDTVQIEYIEIDNEIYYTSTKTKAFTCDLVNNVIFEEMSTEYFTIKHIYSIAD